MARLQRVIARINYPIKKSAKHGKNCMRVCLMSPCGNAAYKLLNIERCDASNGPIHPIGALAAKVAADDFDAFKLSLALGIVFEHDLEGCSSFPSLCRFCGLALALFFCRPGKRFSKMKLRTGALGLPMTRTPKPATAASITS
jgi:hypothetical protein